jgi:hypothetical protein
MKFLRVYDTSSEQYPVLLHQYHPRINPLAALNNNFVFAKTSILKPSEIMTSRWHRRRNKLRVMTAIEVLFVHTVYMTGSTGATSLGGAFFFKSASQ